MNTNRKSREIQGTSHNLSRNWLAGQRVTGLQGSSGLLLAAVHLPLCWALVRHGYGYLGAAVATSLSNLFRMFFVLFQRLRSVGGMKI